MRLIAVLLLTSCKVDPADTTAHDCGEADFSPLSTESWVIDEGDTGTYCGVEDAGPTIEEVCTKVEEGTSGTSPILTAVSHAPGTLDVRDAGRDDESCYGFCIRTAQTGSTLQIDYAFGGEPGPSSEDGCTWDVQYQLSNIPAGTWMLEVENRQIEVTVE